MSRIDAILKAAAQLSPSQLRVLTRKLRRLERRAHAIELKTRKGLVFRLCRLTDGGHLALWRRSLAIAEDYGFYVRLHLSMRDREELNFAQVYLTLKHLCGESGSNLDDYKMAFSFPFAMHVIRGKRRLLYLLEVRNIRDGLYFTLRKPVAKDDPRLKEHLEHKPFEEELDREEINYFITYFYGYLMGRWESLESAPHKPFVRTVPSNLIVFGYCGGATFEEQYDLEEDCEASLLRYREQVRRELQGQTDACHVERHPKS